MSHRIKPKRKYVRISNEGNWVQFLDGSSSEHFELSLYRDTACSGGITHCGSTNESRDWWNIKISF